MKKKQKAAGVLQQRVKKALLSRCLRERNSQKEGAVCSQQHAR